MNKDDYIYLLLLIISIPIGYLFKNLIKTPKSRQISSAIIGFLIVLTVCSSDVLHSVILVLVNTTLLISIHPKYNKICHICI